MRRAIRRLGIGLTILVVALVVATLLTARPGDRALYPPAPGAPLTEIAVVSHGYHAGIVLPRAVLAGVAGTRGHGALIAVAMRFAAYEWIEVGWGDEGFYREVPTVAALTVGLALRALFRPGNPSVLHVVGLSGEPRMMFPQSELIRLRLSTRGLEQLLARLDATFARGNGVVIDDLGPGLYGPSLFYRAKGAFHLANVCNHWIARLLDAAGVPTTPVLATLPQGLFLDLRWRAGLMPEARKP